MILTLAVFVLTRSLTNRAAAVRAEGADMMAKRAAAERALAALRQAAPAASTATPVMAAKPVASAATVTEAEELNQRAAARRILLNSWFDRAYRPLFRQALWTPEQEEALRRAVLDHWLRWCDATDVFLQRKLPSNDPVVQKMAREEWQRFMAETKAAVGPAAFEQVQQFARAAPAKPAADTVAALVFDSGEPLRADQAAKVTAVLAEASPNYAKGRVASLDDVDVPAVLARLKDALTSTQLAALQTALTARQAAVKLEPLLRAAAKQAAEKPPTTTAATTP